MHRKEVQSQKRTKMFGLIQTYKTSGQTQKQFCLDNKINYYTFQSWLRQYRQHHVKSHTRSELLTESGFIQLRPAACDESTTPGENGFTIEYPNGVRFQLGVDPDIKFIHELLKLQV
jgi:hypothetical protein